MPSSRPSRRPPQEVPVPTDAYERLTQLDNTFLMPHIGSATVETRAAMGMRAVDNLEAWFATGEPKDRVA